MKRTNFKCKVVFGVSALFLLMWFYIEDIMYASTQSNDEQVKYYGLQAYKQTGQMHLESGGDLKKNGDIKIHNQTHKMALLVPFKNCSQELNQFAPYMMKFLNDQRLPHTIYVINQVDDFRFNRATLINIGFLESHPDCDYIVMHDVDLLPLNPKLNYSFPSTGPYHVAAPDLHPKYHYSLFVGGILIMTRQHYEKVNGMSNLFWGWGGEDDELALRIIHFGFKIRRPQGIKTGVRNTFRHIHNDAGRPRDYDRFFEQRKIRRRLDLSSGLNNIQYTVESRNTTLINGAHVTFINVQLFCDITKTPWCLNKKDHHVLKT